MGFDDVDAAEAVDLITGLPAGSRFVSALHPELSWTPEREAIADLQDTLWEIAYRRAGISDEPHRVVRPSDVVARRKAAARYASVKRRIAETEWEEVS